MMIRTITTTFIVLSLLALSQAMLNQRSTFKDKGIDITDGKLQPEEDYLVELSTQCNVLDLS